MLNVSNYQSAESHNLFAIKGDAVSNFVGEMAETKCIGRYYVHEHLSIFPWYSS